MARLTRKLVKRSQSKKRTFERQYEQFFAPSHSPFKSDKVNFSFDPVSPDDAVQIQTVYIFPESIILSSLLNA
jgi:hypothetical protein